MKAERQIAHFPSCWTIFRFNSFRISAGERSSRYPSGGADLRCAEPQAEACVPSAHVPDRSRTANGGLGSIHSGGVSWECSSVTCICIRFGFLGIGLRKESGRDPTHTLFRYSWENGVLNPTRRQYPYYSAKAPIVELHIHWSQAV